MLPKYQEKKNDLMCQVGD